MRSWCTTVILRRKNQRVGGYRGRTAVRGGLVRIGSAQLAWRQGKAHAAPAMVCILRSACATNARPPAASRDVRPVGEPGGCQVGVRGRYLPAGFGVVGVLRDL